MAKDRAVVRMVGVERDASFDTTTSEDDALSPFNRMRIVLAPVCSYQPYVVKMRKEKETRRLEEVDLDTGRRRSWLETTEHDVVDFTGRRQSRQGLRCPVSESNP